MAAPEAANRAELRSPVTGVLTMFWLLFPLVGTLVLCSAWGPPTDHTGFSTAAGFEAGLLFVGPFVLGFLASGLAGAIHPERMLPHLGYFLAVSLFPGGVVGWLGYRLATGERSPWVLGLALAGLSLFVAVLGFALALWFWRRSGRPEPRASFLRNDLPWMFAVGLHIYGVSFYVGHAPERPEPPRPVTSAHVPADPSLVYNLAALPGEAWPSLESGSEGEVAPLPSDLVVETRVREEASRFGPRWKQGYDPDWLHEFFVLVDDQARFRIVRGGSGEEVLATRTVSRDPRLVVHRWTTESGLSWTIQLFTRHHGELYAYGMQGSVFQLPRAMELDMEWEVGDSTFRWGPLVDVSVAGVEYPRCWKLLITGGPVRSAVHYYARDLGLVAQRVEFPSGEAQWVLRLRD